MKDLVCLAKESIQFNRAVLRLAALHIALLFEDFL